MSGIRVQHLGQSGFRFDFGGTAVYVDPYLSDSVERAEGPAFRRLLPVPMLPSTITDASAVLISHVHRDHCDPDTILPMAVSSPDCQFMGPRQVIQAIVAAGIDPGRTVTMHSRPVTIGPGLSVHPIPAAHKEIERDDAGLLRYLGYVINCGDKRLLHTGDSRVHDLIITEINKIGPIDVAFLPVNECNFYRDKAGIVGNMSVRDAFSLADDLHVKRVVPMHYDMFAPNQTYREEIQLIYEKTRPSFVLDFEPVEV